MNKREIELPDVPAYHLDAWMVGWNSARGGGTGTIEVGPWPDERGWSSRYEMTAGCTHSSYWSTLSDAQKLQEIVNGFLYLVLGEGLDPAAVHQEFWKIAEYRSLEMSMLGTGDYVVFQGKGRCDPYNPG